MELSVLAPRKPGMAYLARPQLATGMDNMVPVDVVPQLAARSPGLIHTLYTQLLEVRFSSAPGTTITLGVAVVVVTATRFGQRDSARRVAPVQKLLNRLSLWLQTSAPIMVTKHGVLTLEESTHTVMGGILT